MKWSWRIGRIAGIDVYVHATFLLLLAWVAISHYLENQRLADAAYGLFFIITLFGIVVLHELGHALTARRFGIRTRDITLLPIGGLARLERMPEAPRQELLVALAGPAVNVALAGMLLAILAFTSELVALNDVKLVGGSFLANLVFVNVALAVFNMLPAFPMDGGRVLRACLAMRMDYVRATQVAANIGQALALMLGFLGLFSNNPFLVFIALFVWMGAAQEASMVQMKAALAFDRLFKDEVTPGDKSVLDAVLADAQKLRVQISTSDQRKLDEYLDSVRDVEKRIENAGQRGELQGWRPTLDKPNMARPADGIPQDIGEHMRLMCDLMILGFQTDTIRIATLKLNNDHSALRFPNLPSTQQMGHGIDYMIHHLLSHSDGDDWLKVNQFFVEQVAYLTRRLAAIQEGSRTLLNNTMLLFTSSMMAGARHDNDQLPVVVLGGAGGRVLDYSGKSERQMCRLFLSMMDKMNVRQKTFGDATAPL